jgi:hypothetical protein
MPNLDRKIVDNHYQLYDLSCIPSCVEIILKLLHRVPANYYDLQQSWQNKPDGSFADFNNRTIHGLTFHIAYNLPRDNKFPLANLFSTIAQEISQGHYVAVSIENPSGWHMYVVYDMDVSGEFLAVSKYDKDTILRSDLKKVITAMKGTDILFYRD